MIVILTPSVFNIVFSVYIQVKTDVTVVMLLNEFISVVRLY